MSQNTYKRGQVEWALWKYLSSQSKSSEKPPVKFETRIKRLLELDRAGVQDAPGFAFSAEATTGKCSTAAFSAAACAPGVHEAQRPGPSCRPPPRHPKLASGVEKVCKHACLSLAGFFVVRRARLYNAKLYGGMITQSRPQYVGM